MRSLKKKAPDAAMLPFSRDVISVSYTHLDQIFGIHKVDGAIAELTADFFPRIPDHTEKLIIGLKDGVLGIGGEFRKTVEHHGVTGFQFGVLFLERNHALLKLLLKLMGCLLYTSRCV